MSDPTERSWRWKVSDPEANRSLNLLYEPGNWGDILKGSWAAIAARWLVRSKRLETLHYLDPFAGAPTYPVTAPAAERLASAPAGAFSELQRPYLRRGELASTAVVVRDAVGGTEVRLHVFDEDAGRQEAWRGFATATLEPAACGEDVLDAAPGNPHLVLVDPYDLLERWARVRPAVLRAAERGALLLLYLYNKSPRGGGHARAYETFRRTLAEGLRRGGGSLRWVLGRVPSDGVLPRAFHEVVLVGDGGPVSELREELRGTTLELARTLAERGAFEG